MAVLAKLRDPSVAKTPMERVTAHHLAELTELTGRDSVSVDSAVAARRLRFTLGDPSTIFEAMADALEALNASRSNGSQRLRECLEQCCAVGVALIEDPKTFALCRPPKEVSS